MNQRRILVVDDDQDLLMGLGMRLRAQGYDVITAADSYTALATARKERPDLMILDDPSEMRADRRAQRLRDEVVGDR